MRIDGSMARKLRSARFRITLPIVLTFTATAWLLARDGPMVNLEPRPARSAANIHVESNLVLIPVLVTDQADRAITGLERERFRLLDDKAEQVISHFATEDAPASIGVVFDASGSMEKKMNRARAAVSEFLRAANPEDEFSLVEINDRAELLAGFTDRIADIQNRMLFIGAKGRTALLDGIVLSLNEMKHAKHARKAILIISDGGDNNSRYSEREVKNRLREADVQVFALGVLEPFESRSRTPEELGGPALLYDLARQSGGVFEVGGPEELPGIAKNVATALRSQYVLGYVPDSGMRNGKYHKVQVKVDRPKGTPPIHVSFRNGYIAPSN